MNTEFQFSADLARRVENFSLSANVPTNSLIPLFEAVYNSLHSIEDRFKASGDWIKSGKIEIERFGAENQHLRITDNGAGFNDENFASFRTYDSPRKKKIHGKGIGRISWLKVFEKAKVTSVFDENSKRYKREFEFILDSDTPIKNHSLIEVDGSSQIETSINLYTVHNSYRKHFPSKLETLANRIVGHFSAYFLSGQCPSTTLIDDKDSLNLIDYVKEKRLTLPDFTDEIEDMSFRIDSYLVERALNEGGANHLVQFSGANRIVLERSIGSAIGLNNFAEINGKLYFYTGIVHSSFLDENVNTERTSFDVDPKLLEELIRLAITNADCVLQDQISKLIDRQTNLLTSVVKKFPRFSYLVSNSEEFVRSEIPRNARTAESLYTTLSILDFRENRRVERQLDIKSKQDSELDEELDAATKSLIEKVSSQEISALAEYTAKRKVLLDILQNRLGYKPDGDMKNHSEEAVHALICPVRTTKNDIKIEKHNLWILDDKLTYYNFWASDKKIKKYVTSDSDLRPDIALFSGKTLFHRDGTNQPVVIVEFKKPARKNYDYDENPVVQLFDYIEELKGQKVVDKDGVIIDDIEENHPFFCYIVADLTPNLRKYLKATQINLPMPGGSGFYGFNSDYNAYIQVLNWKHVVADARLRNEAFFNELKIN